MPLSRGALRFTPLFTTGDVGLRDGAGVEHVAKVFMHVGEGLATRWIEMPKGILFLQTVPGNAASGGIYLYDRERNIFFFVTFAEGRDDSLTDREFDDLVSEYDLISWTANPARLRACVQQHAMA
jgi:hypothetical protein